MILYPSTRKIALALAILGTCLALSACGKNRMSLEQNGRSDTSVRLIQKAILEDDARFFEREKGRADRWPLDDVSEQARNPLEAAALWGSPKVFRSLLARQGIGSILMPDQVRLLDLCIQNLPYETIPCDQISPQIPEWYDHLDRWYERVSEAQKRKDRILELLIKQGCPIDAANLDGMKPIHVAALHGNMPALRRLLAAGAKRDEPTRNIGAPDPMEPLHGPATIEWHEGKARQHVLLHARNRTALELAILGRFTLASRHLSLGVVDLYFSPSVQRDVICFLIENGADINHRDPDGLTPLMLAARTLACRDFHEPIPGKGANDRFGDPGIAMEILQRLLAKGADPRAVASDLATALSAAVQAGFVEAIPVLNPLTPRELPVPGQAGGNGTFDPRLESLLAALKEGDIATAKSLFTAGMRVFDPGLTGDEDGRHPSAVELAARQSTGLVEFLIAGEKDPARIQWARNLELTGLLQAGDFGSLHQDKSRRIQALQETLGRGARIDPKAGFRWEMLPSIVLPDKRDGDAVFLLMLRQDLPIDPKSIQAMIRCLADVSAPRGLELLGALHDKAGTFESLSGKRDILDQARSARDERFYAQMVRWLGKFDDATCVEELADAVAGDRMQVVAFWLDQGASPYAKSRERKMSALEIAWDHPQTLRLFLEALRERHLINPAEIAARLGTALAKGDVPEIEALDALVETGIKLPALARHPLWAKARPPKDPGNSFYNFDIDTEAKLLRLAKLGVSLNRPFEGEPFLAGMFTHQVIFEGTGEKSPHDAELIRAVLKQGASPKLLVGGATLLHHAAASGQTDIAEVFRDAGIPVDSRTAPIKATPLMWAAVEGDAGMVQWFLKHGANPNLVTTNGWSALGTAKHVNKNHSHDAVIAILEHTGAAVSRPKGLPPVASGQ